MSEVKRYDVQGKFESQNGEGILLVNPKMVLEDDYDAKCHAAEVYFGSWKHTEGERDAAQSELAALREELARVQKISDNYYALTVEANQRLADAERRFGSVTAYVQNLCDAAGEQPSVATGYLRDVLDALTKPEEAKS